ncbi:hypothetical protein niasHT_005366 [Heterodera trifolii]|uniref:G_PROTEIN_RECEP_F1_2 domain-containing protein n=1 Tax=Heterodera trifolii TaxID=157864 RepID=A0ABD2M125_9BILA
MDIPTFAANKTVEPNEMSTVLDGGAEKTQLFLPFWSVLLCAVVMASVAAVGICLNTFLIFVTVQTKQLHGSANALLALNSLFEVFHAFGHFVFLCVALSDRCSPLSYRNSYRSLALSLFGLFAASFSILFSGFDRLFCVLFPLRYFRFSHFWRCFAIAFSLCAIPSVALTVAFWRRGEEVPTMEVTGSIGDLIINGGFAFALYSFAKFACTSATVLLYAFVAVWLWHKRNHQIQSMAHCANRRIFVSLFAIVLFNVGGYFLIAIFYVFWPPSAHPSAQFWLVRMVLSIPANLSGASNAPILFMTSSDYRKAFKKQCRNILLLLGQNRNSAIQPMTLFVLPQRQNRQRQRQNVSRR